MFLESSRYYKQNQITIEDKNNNSNSIRAITLRRLPQTSGSSKILDSNDKLYLISQQKYNNPTMFWHIADTNTELWANDLVKKTDKVKIIMVPDN